MIEVTVSYRQDLQFIGRHWLVIGKVMMSNHLIQRSRLFLTSSSVTLTSLNPSQPHIKSTRTRGAIILLVCIAAIAKEIVYLLSTYVHQTAKITLVILVKGVIQH